MKAPLAKCAHLLRDLPAKGAILDAEIIANNRNGAPDFCKLHTRSAEPTEPTGLRFAGSGKRQRSLDARRQRLQDLVDRFDCPAVLFSEAFSDPAKLLQEAERLRLEGIVRSGDRRPTRFFAA